MAWGIVNPQPARGRGRIVGTGASTAVGLTAPATAAAVRAGIAAMSSHPFMIDKAGAPMRVCAHPALPVELTIEDRFQELALPPALESLGPLFATADSPAAVAMFVALPEPRPGVPVSLASTFAARFRDALGRTVNIADLACEPIGHAGGLWCMEQALSALASGRCQVCLVGGVDSYLARETLEWLDDLDQLHSETTTWGFCPGEGAGFCLLATEEFAFARGLDVDVEVVAAASAIEPNTIKTETVCVGQGLTAAFRASLSALPPGSLVAHTISDMNGEPYRANEYGFAVLRSATEFSDDADFQTPADCWGDVGAASGTLFAVLATFAARKKYCPGPVTFVCASSEGGLRGTALVRSTA